MGLQAAVDELNEPEKSALPCGSNGTSGVLQSAQGRDTRAHALVEKTGTTYGNNQTQPPRRTLVGVQSAQGRDTRAYARVEKTGTTYGNNQTQPPRRTLVGALGIELDPACVSGRLRDLGRLTRE